MNSRLTLLLAGILLAGAVAAGYWGVSLSRQSAESARQDDQASVGAVVAEVQERIGARVEDEQRSPVVVLARDLKALTPIVAEDLAVERLRIAPPGSFSKIEDIIGRTVWRELPAGSVLNAASFEMGGPLARMIRPQERALAIAVDEVVGGGGHLMPGDYVDVLLFLSESDKNRDQTAQVVIPALRVLSYGEALGATNSGEPAVAPERESEEDAKRVRRRKDPARTAVLAVPEQLLTRFMLASEVGTLRLAVRSADERLLASYYAGAPLQGDVEELKRQLFQFEKLALRQARQPQSGLVRQQAAIHVYRGTDVSRQTP